MSNQNDPVQAKSWLGRFGLWAGLALVAAVATTVFALVACKSSGW